MSWWQTQIGFQVLQHGRPALSLFSVDRLRCGRPGASVTDDDAEGFASDGTEWHRATTSLWRDAL